MKNKILHNIITNARDRLLFFYRERLNTFYRGSLLLLLVLCLVRMLFPSVLDGVGVTEHQSDAPAVAEVKEDAVTKEQLASAEETPQAPVAASEPAETSVQEPAETLEKTALNNYTIQSTYKDPKVRSLNVQGKWHAVGHVASYEQCFPDSQSVQLVAAQRWGVNPPKDRAEAEQRKNELVYVGGSPYFHQDEGMTSSIPYLVPRASHLLNRIGRNFFDSLYVKGLPLHKIIVSSVLRSEADVAKLSGINGNVSKQSCHRYGTTFDICWTRFQPVRVPGGSAPRYVGDDVLKYVLSEVLRDLREEGACYVKHEVKQTCFHITVR